MKARDSQRGAAWFCFWTGAAFALLGLTTASSAAKIEPVAAVPNKLHSQKSSQSSPSPSHPTKITGFGSRNRASASESLRKSLLGATSFAAPISSSSSTSSSTSSADHKLWIQTHDDQLFFRSDSNNCSLTFSVDHGVWNLQRSDCHVDSDCNNDNNNTNNTTSTTWLPIEGIYGIYTLSSGVVWVLISSSSTVLTSDPWGEIRRVESMDMIHIPSTRDEALTPRQSKEQIRQLQLLRQALKSHELYYTTGQDKMDITQSIQRAMTKSKADVGTWWNGSALDSRFFWNEPALQPLLERINDDYTVLLDHCIPVTSAFVGVQRNISINQQLSYDEVLISRRSRFRSGTRFTKRGADATGAVANYAETEQTCLIGNHTILSHVQTRGSIPLRWSSPADVKTYRPRVRIGTDPVAQARALQNHLLSEWNHYVLPTPATHSKMVILNLIDKKKDQGRLGRAFDAVLRAVLDAHANVKVNEVSPKTIEHLWFDFHAEVKGGRWHTLARLLKQLSPTLAEHGYFKASRDASNQLKVDRLQGGVVRTNCMDCLDRTNVVQSILGRYALFNELIGMTTSKNEKLLPVEFSNTFRTNALALPWSEGEISHRALWADNADAISRLYAGTPALKRDFTRTGKRTKLGALDDGVNSLQRYYLNNFMDADRQEGVDLMTGYATFAIMRDEDDPNDGTASSNFSIKKRANMSLLQAARSILDEQDDGEVLSEASFVHIKKHRKNPLSQLGGPTLDLRWLPGDLQSHMKASANANALQDLDRRTASDTPWWVIDEDLADKDDHDELHLPVNIGHLLGGLIAVIQAPVSTATTILLVLGSMYRENDHE